MDAQSTGADKALAKASAKGVSTDKYEKKFGKSDDEVMSGDFGDDPDGAKKPKSAEVLADNSDNMKQPDTSEDDKTGDKGDWSVAIAAAVVVFPTPPLPEVTTIILLKVSSPLTD